MSNDPTPQPDLLAFLAYHEATDHPALAIDALVVTAHCCRDWPVLATAPIGHCGICGERPVIIWNTDREKPPEPSAR